MYVGIIMLRFGYKLYTNLSVINFDQEELLKLVIMYILYVEPTYLPT
jgi:hypothetical protein